MKHLATMAAVIVLATSGSATAAQVYEIEAAVNDETFIINGEVFKAKTWCLYWSEGDEVVFIDGSPYGVCLSATIFNMSRKEACEVWCD